MTSRLSVPLSALRRRQQVLLERGPNSWAARAVPHATSGPRRRASTPAFVEVPRGLAWVPAFAGMMWRLSVPASGLRRWQSVSIDEVAPTRRLQEPPHTQRQARAGGASTPVSLELHVDLRRSPSSRGWRRGCRCRRADCAVGTCVDGARPQLVGGAGLGSPPLAGRGWG